MDMYQKTYSRKQVGVLYRAHKEGKLELTRDEITFLYDNVGGAEIYCQGDLKRAKTLAYCMSDAVKAILEDENYAEAREIVDAMVTA